ncbi:MAG: oligosaccharide flippase family protein [Geobacteraceae bacterium]|nr:oligosaccharide flippase family protein [Geobacteraceae bacterium]
MTSLRRNVIANLVGRAWTNFLGILFVPLYLRFLGIESYGLIGFYTALQSILGLLDLGIGSTMNRELARLSALQGTDEEQRNVVRTLESIYWIIAVAGGGLIVFLAPYVSRHWVTSQGVPPEIVLKALRLMGIAVALQFPFSLYQGGLMGLQRQVLVNIILSIIGTLRSGGAVLVLWLVSPSISAFLTWHIIVGIIGSLTLFAVLWQRLPQSHIPAVFDKKILAGLWKYSSAISANAIIGIALTQMDKVVLSGMLPLKMFGYYALATTVSSAIWLFILPLNNAIFPRFVQLYEIGNLNQLKMLVHRSSQMLAVALAPISVILILFSGDILYLWTLDENVRTNAQLLVSLLVIGTTLNGIASIPAYAVAAFGSPQLITIVNLCQATVVIPLIIVAVRNFGAPGAAFVWILLNSTFVTIMAPLFFKRFMKGNYRNWVIRDNLMIFLPILIAAGGFYPIVKGVEGSLEKAFMLGFVWISLSLIGMCFSKYVREFLLNLKSRIM